MTGPVSDDARALYNDSDVIDLHIDSFLWTRMIGYDLTKRHGTGLLGGRLYSQVDIPRAVQGGLTGATWVITTNPYRTARGRRRTFAKNFARLKGILDGDGRTQVVRNVAEYRTARALGKHAAFLGIQGGNALDDGLDALDDIPDDGILRITLVHLSSSSLGGTSSPLRFWGAKGLTDFGRDYIRRLNEKKIFVDLAHISRQGFFEAVDVHDKSQPLIVTHTGISGVTPHWRNLDDEQLRAVADTGGTIGVMFQSQFLGGSPLGTTSARVVNHLEHIVNVVGDDHASIGTDWDGMVVPPRDLQTPEDLPNLVQCMLDRGWGDERIRKILGGNVLRVIETLRG